MRLRNAQGRDYTRQNRRRDTRGDTQHSTIRAHAVRSQFDTRKSEDEGSPERSYSRAERTAARWQQTVAHLARAGNPSSKPQSRRRDTAVRSDKLSTVKDAAPGSVGKPHCTRCGKSEHQKRDQC